MLSEESIPAGALESSEGLVQFLLLPVDDVPGAGGLDDRSSSSLQRGKEVCNARGRLKETGEYARDNRHGEAERRGRRWRRSIMLGNNRLFPPGRNAFSSDKLKIYAVAICLLNYLFKVNR